MRVISASKFWPPEVLRIEERPIPDPKAGEVIVEVKAAGINLMDSYLRRGLHPSAPLPLVLGVEGAGVVIAVDGQSTARIGDRVAWQGVPGSYAEMVAVPDERLIPIPESVTFEAAAGGLMQGLTAQHLCYDAVPVPDGAVVLVHSAASGVGRMLTARPATEAGAWQVPVRDQTADLGAAIRDLTGGSGVDVVFDGTGKTLFDVSISALHFKGVFVHYGRAGGPIPPLNLWDQPDGVHLVRASGVMPLMSRSTSGGGARRK